MFGYIGFYGVAIVNFITFVSFIISLCTKSENKKFVCYMHLLFWVVFNITFFIVGILPILTELNKINVIY